MPEPLPHEEETLEVVRTAARITFGEEVTEDQCVQLHDLIRAGFRLKDLDLMARNDIDATVWIPLDDNARLPAIWHGEIRKKVEE